jgi:transcriptional regulator with XRE-family HTH domain
MFNERLANLREKTGLSQKELSARLGIARTTYAGYENGSREPDLNMLNKLAEYFQVNIDWLITGRIKQLDEDDQKLIEEFAKLDDRDQAYILELMERLKKEQH